MSMHGADKSRTRQNKWKSDTKGQVLKKDIKATFVGEKSFFCLIMRRVK